MERRDWDNDPCKYPHSGEALRVGWTWCWALSCELVGLEVHEHNENSDLDYVNFYWPILVLTYQYFYWESLKLSTAFQDATSEPQLWESFIFLAQLATGFGFLLLLSENICNPDF